jgi:hypothetical protein
MSDSQDEKALATIPTPEPKTVTPEIVGRAPSLSDVLGVKPGGVEKSIALLSRGRLDMVRYDDGSFVVPDIKEAKGGKDVGRGGKDVGRGGIGFSRAPKKLTPISR